ncbi:SapC family protein [Tianweitania sediminis]|uniref:SapC family protein n=1 Tax=Tianweitania sediminis TaxID=1502156 RepID=A0A8J7UKH9_9HYPH|nr:SapC family protein [Tianweitania sediminis]MBP0441198.1 SapC family protein [Tianweitania sediminis]
MTSAIHAVTRDRHSAKKWLTPQNFSFAGDRHFVPITNAEVGHAARALPLAFVQAGDNYVLVAVLGLTPNRNLLVGPNGRWLGLYTPAYLRSYPFRLSRTNDDKLALCVDEESGLVKDSAVGDQGHPFFDEAGGVAPETQRMMQFMTTLQQAEQATAVGVRALQEANLIEPWPLKLGSGENAQSVAGLFRVNEAALNALEAEPLLTLRKAGALALAYAQLISAGNIQVLGSIMGAQDKANAQRMTVPEKSFLPEDDGSLKIDWNTFLKN